ncbi:MAG TPA: LPS export ABC transporter periplasmic protein LptC [Candidatus Sulfotelmatobacter sp.]|jgi:lipopolysaccharide export system protein LptC|nr:LPS export ABC transporter periplasmic protein LptC [Candidatus Sulfotelmatobacter sp.]
MEIRPPDIRIDSEDREAHRRHVPSMDGGLPARSAGSRSGNHNTVRTMLVRYTRFVSLMKMLLPAIAAALLGLVVIWPKIAPRDTVFREAFANFNIKTIDTQSMQNPHYYGTDNRNMPFSVTANYASQVDLQNNVMSLDSPVADFTRKDGSGIILSADSGLFRQKDEILDLLGHVDLYQDNGFEMHTNSARLFVKQGEGSGDDPTHAQSPHGTIDGEGFRLKDRGRTIIFTGKCKAVLITAKSSKDKSAKPKSGPKSGKDKS